MKKKFLISLFLIIILVCVFPFVGCSPKNKPVDYKKTGLSFIFNNDSSASVVRLNDKIKKLEIPSKVIYNNKVYNVTDIASQAFRDCTSLTSVTIPNSIKSIGDYAFFNCSGLKSLDIPASITSIGFKAFSSCNGLSSINVDKFNRTFCSKNGILFDYSVTTLIYAPTGIQGNKSIPSTVTSIANFAYEDCTELTSVIIPNKVKNIGEGAFRGCKKLKSVTIPNSVIDIGNGAFDGCVELTELSIPNSVKSIGESAFSGCNKLKSITIPNSVALIGSKAFWGCEQLSTIYCEATIKPVAWDNDWNALKYNSQTGYQYISVIWEWINN